MQKSVFECFITLDEMKKLKVQVEKRAQLPEDNIRFYWISADALPRTLVLGSEMPSPPPSAYII